MSNDYKVVIIHSREVVAQGLKSILEKDGFKIMALWANATQAACPGTIDADLDIILLGHVTESSIRPEAINRLHLLYGSARIVLLADVLNDSMLRLAMQSDVYCIMSEEISSSALALALKLVAGGEMIFPLPWVLNMGLAFDEAPLPCKTEDHDKPPAVERINAPNALGQLRRPLSNREAEVADFLTCGYPNKVIARKLDITEATVKVHIKAILRKTGARNRTEVALLASVGKQGTGSRAFRSAEARELPLRLTPEPPSGLLRMNHRVGHA